MNRPKLRPETSTSVVGMGIIEARLSVFLRGSNAWHFSSVCGACF